MISFYRHSTCPECDQIQAALEEMVLAHKVIPWEEQASGKGIPGTDLEPPVLVDGDEIYRGSDEILSHLKTLRCFKEEWDKFQSDSCYCGDDGEIE